MFHTYIKMTHNVKKVFSQKSILQQESNEIHIDVRKVDGVVLTNHAHVITGGGKFKLFNNLM